MGTPNQLIPLIENMLLSPGSNCYLSKILHDRAGGAADPAYIATFDLGTFTIAGIDLGLVLDTVTIKGLSNVQVKITPPATPDISVTQDTVTFGACLPNRQPGYTRPADVPDQVEISAGLTVSIGGTAMPPGSMSVVVKSVTTFTGVFDATETTPGDLTTARIDLRSITLDLDTSGGNVVLSLSLQTGFAAAINQVLNQTSTIDGFVSLTQQQFNDPKILTRISAVATEAARQAFSQAAVSS